MLDQLDFDSAEAYVNNVPEKDLLKFIDDYNRENRNVLTITFAIHMFKKTGALIWKNVLNTALKAGFNACVGYDEAYDLLNL